MPALLEGDQVLLINGRDISEHTHQQVVMFIKASRESHSKELALLVRRKGLLSYCDSEFWALENVLDLSFSLAVLIFAVIQSVGSKCRL